jgi:hypothetical protein
LVRKGDSHDKKCDRDPLAAINVKRDVSSPDQFICLKITKEERLSDKKGICFSCARRWLSINRFAMLPGQSVPVTTNSPRTGAE